MSLLIKGIGMPDCCNTCPCCQRVFAWRYGGSYCGATGREIVDLGKINENCPLVEVPPVIRCKDCKHAHMTFSGDCKYCDLQRDDDGFLIEDYKDGDWYCAGAEMKSAEE